MRWDSGKRTKHIVYEHSHMHSDSEFYTYFQIKISPKAAWILMRKTMYILIGNENKVCCMIENFFPYFDDMTHLYSVP